MVELFQIAHLAKGQENACPQGQAILGTGKSIRDSAQQVGGLIGGLIGP